MTPHVLAGWFVVQTYCVCAHRESTPLYYEIYVAPTLDGQRIKLVTRNTELYDFAVAIEGCEEPMDIEWAVEMKRPKGHAVELLTGLRRAAA